MTDIKRIALTNRVDTLREIVAALRQERNFWLRQQAEPWDRKARNELQISHRITDTKQRLREAERRLKSCEISLSGF